MYFLKKYLFQLLWASKYTNVTKISIFKPPFWHDYGHKSVTQGPRDIILVAKCNSVPVATVRITLEPLHQNKNPLVSPRKVETWDSTPKLGITDIYIYI